MLTEAVALGVPLAEDMPDGLRLPDGPLSPAE